MLPTIDPTGLLSADAITLVDTAAFNHPLARQPDAQV